MSITSRIYWILDRRVNFAEILQNAIAQLELDAETNKYAPPKILFSYGPGLVLKWLPTKLFKLWGKNIDRFYLSTKE